MHLSRDAVTFWLTYIGAACCCIFFQGIYHVPTPRCLDTVSYHRPYVACSRNRKWRTVADRGGVGRLVTYIVSSAQKKPLFMVYLSAKAVHRYSFGC